MTAASDAVGLMPLLREALERLAPAVAAIQLRRLYPSQGESQPLAPHDGRGEWKTVLELFEGPNDWKQRQEGLAKVALPSLAELALPRDEIEADRALDRLVQLIRHADATSANWSETTRVDPLRIASQFLAVPSHPYTLDIARSVTARALAEAYGVRYEGALVRGLRRAHDALAARLRQGDVVEITHGQRDRTSTHFLVDCLCLGGWCERVAPTATFQSFLASIIARPKLLGLSGDGRERHRIEYLLPEDRPFRLRRTQPLPSINEIVRFAFSQPTGIPGFDMITGGLLGPMRPIGVDLSKEPSLRGLVTLIAGPAGTGKTTLALAIASRLAELGIRSEFFGVEEPVLDLFNRVLAGGGRLWTAFESAIGTIISEGQLAPQFQRLSSRVRLSGLRDDAESEPVETAWDFPFSRCLVIDSVTALLDGAHGAQDDNETQGLPNVTTEVFETDEQGDSSREGLMRALSILRRNGTAVFLVGTPEDVRASDLAYLADNVISLDVEFPETGEARRTLTLEKTRQQLSRVGKHRIELRGFGDLDVLPSLPTWLDWAASRETVAPDIDQFVFVGDDPDQFSLAIDTTSSGLAQRISHPLRIRAHAQTLIFGLGSSYKARIALSFALGEPRYLSPPTPHQQKGVSRTLVISFLYDARYYESAARDYFSHRSVRPKDLRDAVDVFVIPPGAVGAADVVAEIERRLDVAELEGRPFSCAVIDGVHNLLVQFPRIAHEPLFLPTVMRTLHTRPLSVFVTFTRFGTPRFPAYNEDQNLEWIVQVDTAEKGNVHVSQELLYHLLVSRVDYSLLAHRLSSKEEREITGRPEPRQNGLVKIALTQSIDHGPLPPLMYWDPELMGPATSLR